MATVVVVIFLFPPAGPSLPVSQIIAAGVIVYFASFEPRPNKLGLSFQIAPQAKRAIFLILAITAAVLLLSWIFIAYAKYDFIQRGIEDSEIWRQGNFEFFGSWAPDSAIYQSLYKKDLPSVLKYAFKPILGMVVFAGVFETVIFFGVLFPVLWKRNKYVPAILITSLIFALAHILRTNFPGFFIIIGTGLIQAMLYSKTKSLYPSIVFHLCWNFNIVYFICLMNWGVPYIPSGG